jgi:predicted metal-dependent hydrolase
MEYSIKTDRGVLEFKLVRRKMKNIRIRVTGGRQVVVSAPHRCSERVIHEFIRDSEAFIHGRLGVLEEQRRCYYPATYVDGELFSFLGQRVRLRVQAASRASAVFENNILYLFVPPGGCAKTQFIRWMSGQARMVFLKRLTQIEPWFNGADGLTISVRRMLTRRGSINPTRRRLSLSVHLMRCDQDLIDYVITHELCHLGCLGHSAAFYRALEVHYPNRRAMDKRLEAYGLVDY